MDENSIQSQIPDDSEKKDGSVTFYTLPQKTKVKIAMLLVIVVILMIVSVFVSRINVNQPDYKKAIDNTINSQYDQEFIGILRTTGLDKDSQNRLGLRYGNLQLTDLTYIDTAGKNVSGYFINSFLRNESEFIGKCVKVQGKIESGWETCCKADAFNRLAISIGNIEEISMDRCLPVSNSEYLNMPKVNEEKIVLKGILLRSTRPSPEINYDYSLRLTSEFVDETSPAGSPMKLESIVVLSSTPEMRNAFESNINSEIEVSGYLQWGLAESKHFLVESLIPVDYSGLKKLIRDFDIYYKQSRANDLFSLFTLPKSEYETEQRDFLIDQLFKYDVQPYKLDTISVARAKYPGSYELISLVDGKYFATLDEVRLVWDADTQRLSKKSTYQTVMEIVDENGKLLIDKYYQQKSSPQEIENDAETLKYDAFWLDHEKFVNKDHED